MTVPEMFPLSGRELTAAAYVIIQSSRDPRTPSTDPMSTPDLWLMAAWRLVRRGARLRGLLADGRGKQNLTEIASRPEQPFERPFTYESVPTNAALMAYLIAHPCPLLPSPQEHEGYYEILAEDLEMHRSMEGRIGLNQIMIFGPPTLQELIRFEPQVIRKCSKMIREDGLGLFAENCENTWDWTPSEAQDVMALVIASQAEGIAIHDPQTLISAQIHSMERLAAEMEKGVQPDLRGAAMIRREIARLLLRQRTENNDTAELARFIQQIGPELERPTPKKKTEKEEREEIA